MTTQARADILNPDRRQLLSQAAMTAVAASVASLLPLRPAKAAASGAIRPFRVSVPEEDLLDLRRRLAATRWPDREIVADQSQGVQLTTLQQLVRYWQNDYDWRKMEARLNAMLAIYGTVSRIGPDYVLNVQLEARGARPDAPRGSTTLPASCWSASGQRISGDTCRRSRRSRTPIRARTATRRATPASRATRRQWIMSPS